VRRFDLEHTFRFLKQSMGWATPRVGDAEGTPPRAGRPMELAGRGGLHAA
jgi:hypothetical protein